MSETCHSLCLDFLTVMTRFWFPWVMLLECQAVKLDHPNWDDEERMIYVNKSNRRELER
jgi:hypothetical protein